MGQVILLRIAAAVQLLFAVGHMLGGLKRWSPMGSNPVLDLMASRKFDVMGASRSYLDLYLGFGWTLGVLGLMQAALLWQIASLAKTAPAQATPMVAVIALANLAAAIITWKFLFLVPALFSLVLVAVLAAAVFLG